MNNRPHLAAPRGQGRRRNRHWLRAAAAAVAVTVAASACSSTPDSEPEPAEAASPASTEAVPTTAAVPATTTEAMPADTEPPRTTEAPAPTTTTEAPPPTEALAPAPSITWRSVPRLHETTLSASWHVEPGFADSGEAADADCRFDLLDADGGVVVSGTAEVSRSDASRRRMSVEHDPADSDGLGTVAVRCSLPGSDPSAAEHPVRRVAYQGRHPDSVFPADDDHYFDHDEVAALFPECGPSRGRYLSNHWGGYGAPDGLENASVAGNKVDRSGDGWVSVNEWLDANLDFWEEAYENWDTAKLANAAGHEFATGWWTARQLRMRFPYSTLTAENAPRHLSYEGVLGVLTVTPGSAQNFRPNPRWSVSPVRGTHEGYVIYNLKSLYLRLEDAVGFVNTDENPVPYTGVIAAQVTDRGLPGRKANPPSPRVVPENLLWDWMDTRYSFAPNNREPTAWAMRTLLKSRDSECVAHGMRVHCESGDFHDSPHMRHPSQGGSRLGSVLWSLVCPEIRP